MYQNNIAWSEAVVKSQCAICNNYSGTVRNADIPFIICDFCSETTNRCQDCGMIIDI